MKLFLQGLLKHRLAMLAAAVLLAAGLWWLHYSRGSAGDLSYDTAAVSRGNISVAVSSSGAVSPLVTVTVGSQVSGQLTQVLVDYNSVVKQGQLVAVVDPATFRSKLQSALADMAVQRANIGSNEVQVSNAQVMVNQAQRDYDRAKALNERGLISNNDMEKARDTLEQAQNQAKIAAATLNNSKAQLIKVQAQLDQARIDLSRTEIRSPVDGVVIERDVDVGQTVQAAMTAPTLFKVARDLSQVQIETKVDEADIGAVQQARRATFTVDAYPERTFSGRIAQVRINGSTSSNVVTYSVMVQADNPGQILLPGMTANVKLITGERSGVLRVPSAALRFHPGTASGAGAGGAGARPGAPAGASAAGGGSARGLVELTPEVMQQLGMDARAQQAATAALKSAIARIKAERQASSGSGSNPLGGGMPNFRRMFGNPGDDATASRQRLLNALAGVMSEEQLQKYQALSATQTVRSATVYVPGAAGQPEARSVRVGLADDNYTELISGLAEGDKVVVRARAAQKS
jgi:HlyD family secretion protein